MLPVCLIFNRSYNHFKTLDNQLTTMDAKLPILPARYYLRLLDVLLKRDVPIHELLADLQLDANQINHLEDAKLTTAQVEGFILGCLKYPQNRDLAFELGTVLKLSSHSLVGYVLLTSENLRQALYHVAQYFRLIIPNFQLQVREQHDSVYLDFSPTMPMSRLILDFHIEAIAVAFYHNLSELVGDTLPSFQVDVSIAAPSHLARYAQLKSAQFHFGRLLQPGVHMQLPCSLLDRALPMADALSLKVVKNQCQDLLKQMTDRGEVADWLHMMLLHAHQLPTLTECAKMLNISVKTLQRHLQHQGQNFAQIRQTVLLQRAQDALLNSSKSVVDIADELGYATASNFIRQFKAATQMTPQQYRLQQ